MSPLTPPDPPALTALGILWHRVTPILGASILLAWGITRCVDALSM